MAKKSKTKKSYTLWTIPRAEWKSPSTATTLPENAAMKLKNPATKLIEDARIKSFCTGNEEVTTLIINAAVDERYYATIPAEKAAEFYGEGWASDWERL